MKVKSLYFAHAAVVDGWPQVHLLHTLSCPENDIPVGDVASPELCIDAHKGE